LLIQRCLALAAGSLLGSTPLAAQSNPITSTSRLWGQWDVAPNTQWAPNSIDPTAKPDRNLHIFRLQPVFPFRLSDQWTLLTQTIFRFVSAPTARSVFGPTPLGLPGVVGWKQRNDTGLSDITPTAFFVPNLGPHWTLGAGTSVVIPVGDGVTDSGKVSVGPALIGYYHRGPWVAGLRLVNVWSVAGDPSRKDVNRMVLRPLLRYQLNRHWFLRSDPIISIDWMHPTGDGWTVPIGGGVGYSFRLAKQPMQVSVEGYYNAVQPTFSGEKLLGDVTIRTQLQILFPK